MLLDYPQSPPASLNQTPGNPNKDQKLYYVYNFLGIGSQQECSGDNVSQEGVNPGTFNNGTILGVGVDVSPESYLDIEREAAGALARD